MCLCVGVCLCVRVCLCVYLSLSVCACKDSMQFICACVFVHAHNTCLYSMYVSILNMYIYMCIIIDFISWFVSDCGICIVIH